MLDNKVSRHDLCHCGHGRPPDPFKTGVPFCVQSPNTHNGIYQVTHIKIHEFVSIVTP